MLYDLIRYLGKMLIETERYKHQLEHECKLAKQKLSPREQEIQDTENIPEDDDESFDELQKRLSVKLDDALNYAQSIVRKAKIAKQNKSHLKRYKSVKSPIKKPELQNHLKKERKDSDAPITKSEIENNKFIGNRLRNDFIIRNKLEVKRKSQENKQKQEMNERSSTVNKEFVFDFKDIDDILERVTTWPIQNDSNKNKLSSSSTELEQHTEVHKLKHKEWMKVVRLYEKFNLEMCSHVRNENKYCRNFLTKLKESNAQKTKDTVSFEGYIHCMKLLEKYPIHTGKILRRHLHLRNCNIQDPGKCFLYNDAKQMKEILTKDFKKRVMESQIELNRIVVKYLEMHLVDNPSAFLKVCEALLDILPVKQ